MVARISIELDEIEDEILENMLNNVYIEESSDLSRPKPNVILEHTDNTTYKCEQILEAEAIWAVFYMNKPFNLKSSNMLTNYPGPKYKKVSFSNPGHAHNLANKLNEMFECNDFNVHKLTDGEIVHEE